MSKERLTDRKKGEASEEDRLEATTDSESELDISSNAFNAIRALYTADYRVTGKEPKVLYQNLAAFESALNKVGIWNLNKRKQSASGARNTGVGKEVSKQQDEQPGTSQSSRHIVMEEDDAQQRRFLPHQMTVRGSGQRSRHQRNLFRQMESAGGPLAQLHKWVKEHQRVQVVVRKEHGVRGSIEGRLLCFDKHWNLLLRDVTETWQRRKYKYSDNRCCGVPQNCARQLRDLGILWPEQRVKNLNRKKVQITRELPQLLLRGEQVVIVTLLPLEEAQKCDLLKVEPKLLV